MRAEANPDYFRGAAAEFREAWQQDGISGVGAWCKKFWPISAAVAALLGIFLCWLIFRTPEPPLSQDKFQEKLKSSGEWTDVRWLQADPKKAGGTYVAMATYTQKYRCKFESAGRAVSLQFFRLGHLRDNGAEVAKPVAKYDLGPDGVLRTSPGNDETLREAARQVIDAYSFATTK